MALQTILAVDTDVNVHNEQTAEWAKHNIDTRRVDTMHDAIAWLVRGNNFLFVAINEDSIPDFMSQLQIMRDITNFPIFVITSNYTVEKRDKAIDFGADVYEPFNKYAKDDVLVALATLKAQNRWANRSIRPLKILLGGNIILSPQHRSVFVKDTEVTLTKLEFDLLQYLMANSGLVMTHKQIFRKIWGYHYEDASRTLLRNNIKRLRDALKVLPDSMEYIETIRDVGYRFSQQVDK